eukprot:Rmarinus@m.17842
MGYWDNAPALDLCEDEKQKSRLQELKDAAGPLPAYYNDGVYVRFLQFCGWNVRSALKLLRASVDQRKELFNDSEPLDWEPPEVLRRYLSGSVLPGAFDEKNRPVFLAHVGYTDYVGFARCVRREDFYRMRLHMYDGIQLAINKSAKETGKSVYQVCTVLDVSGLNLTFLSKAALELIVGDIGVGESNFPDLAGRIFVVNTPRVFSIVWNIVSPILGQSTLKFVKIVPNAFDLTKHLPRRAIPRYMGGEAEVPDTHNEAGKIPQSFLEGVRMKSEGAISVNVPRGGCEEITITIETEGVCLSWEFATEDHDIAFALRFVGEVGAQDEVSSKKKKKLKRKSKKKKKKRPEGDYEILPSRRVDSHIVPETGTHRCEHAGVYALVFDNSYSMLRSKNVTYVFDVLETASDDEDGDDNDGGGNGDGENENDGNLLDDDENVGGNLGSDTDEIGNGVGSGSGSGGGSGGGVGSGVQA